LSELIGYRGEALRLLKEYDASIGDVVEVKLSDGQKRLGTLMPRYELADDKHITIKLSNGYNIGVSVKRIKEIKRVSKGEKPTFVRPKPPKPNPNFPLVSIISTGGTIASRVDYRTGAVHPALSAEDLYSTVPELSSLARIDAEILLSIFSENMTAKEWRKIALTVEEKIRKGASGVIITHGTDTMGYTAAALSFALNNLPLPIVLVGSQRSSDRPSSDASLNLIGAVNLCIKADFSGVFVVMHSGLGDDELAVHLGTKVRKNHTSRRDAFESVNISPVAYIRNSKIIKVSDQLKPRKSLSEANFKVKPDFEEKVALVKFVPGLTSDIITFFSDKGYKGLVIEGTGLGHVSSSWYNAIKNAIDNGMLIGLTSQCLWGRVRMTVYETGRDLLSIGVIPLEDMLPETAYVKMMWVLANSKDLDKAKELMRRNIAGEISSKSIADECM
jgi:glutamyl-tRNA(Gln) amidotransferase subunit D